MHSVCADLIRSHLSGGGVKQSGAWLLDLRSGRHGELWCKLAKMSQFLFFLSEFCLVASNLLFQSIFNFGKCGGFRNLGSRIASITFLVIVIFGLLMESFEFLDTPCSCDGSIGNVFAQLSCQILRDHCKPFCVSTLYPLFKLKICRII